MTGDFSRTDRISSSIQKALALIIRDEIKDPRLGLVTIHAVQVVRDLSQAKVFFTVLDTGFDDIEKQRELSGRILQKASGFIRRQLGKAVQLRSLPELHFVYDRSIEEGSRLHALIEEVVRSDSETGSDE